MRLTSTITVNIRLHYLAPQLLIGTSHFWLLTFFYLWGRALCFQIWDARSSTVSPLYSAGLSSPAIFFLRRLFFIPLILDLQFPKVSLLRIMKIITSQYPIIKRFLPSKMTSIVSPYTFENG